MSAQQEIRKRLYINESNIRRTCPEHLTLVHVHSYMFIFFLSTYNKQTASETQAAHTSLTAQEKNEKLA